ncbi:MAG TPA: TonB-dependent receptor [Pseudomonadales bacterium]
MKLKYLVPAAAAAVVVVGVPPAQAQEGALEEIVVTGSYLRRAPEDAPSPIRAFGREELEVRGRPQLADLVATLPSVIGSENVTAQEQSVGGAGAANINIRNLGLSSTLVLLEGKRLNKGTSVSNQSETFVDINRLPFIMIENVEILKDGASALYGSDAVAGVANFRLRNNFEGFEIQGTYQDAFKGRDLDFDDFDFPEMYREPIENISKDTHSETDLGAIWGFGNDTTHMVIGFNYFERDRLDSVDREYAFEDIIDGSVSAPSPFNMPQDQFASLDLPFMEEPEPSSYVVQDPACVAFGYYRTRNSGLCSTKTDLLSRDMMSKERRKQALATWTHQLNDRVEAYGHFGFSENEVELNQSPSLPITAQARYTADNPGFRHHVISGINAFLASGGTATSYGDDVANRLGFLPEDVRPLFMPIAGLPVVPLFDPAAVGVNPFDPESVFSSIGTITFNGVARPSIANLMNIGGVPADVDGDGVVEPGEIFKGRASQLIERETRLFLAGLRGDLNDDWTFDVSYGFSGEEQRNTFYDTVNERLADALNGYFGIGCDKATMAPGEGLCTWFNPFGSSILEPDTVVADGNGNLHTLGNDAAYVDALFGQGVVTGDSELTVLDAVVTTDSLFGWQLPGGSVGLALGAQYREEERRAGGNELATDPSFPFAFTGPTIPYSAKEDVYAIFAELALPLTEDLEAQLAVRYEDYGGATGDTVDPKLALRWQALDSLVLRGSVGTSFRGPSLTQKFGRGTGLQFISAPDAEVIDAFFGPGASEAPLFGSGVFGRLPTFGNPDLKPEESTNFNIGVIWSPTDDFSLCVDYFDYDYDNIIIPEDYVGLANDCQINWGLAGRPASLLSDGSPNPAYMAIEACNFRDLDGDPTTPDILLDTQGNALSIQRTYQNGTELKASGLDVLARYNLATNWGAFGATLDFNWFLEYEIQRAVTPFDTRLNPGETVDMVGLNYTVLVGRPLPEYKATLLLDWSLNQHYASVVTNFVSHVWEPDYIPEPLRVASHTTVDASYTYQFQTVNLGLTAGAMNLFDREPPRASGFNGFSSTLHDPRGRMWYLRARFGF